MRSEAAAGAPEAGIYYNSSGTPKKGQLYDECDGQGYTITAAAHQIKETLRE